MAVTETRLGEFGIQIGGSRRETGETYEIRSPYDDSTVAVVHRATPDDVEEAIANAVTAFETTRRLPSWQREQILTQISQGIAARREEIGETIVAYNDNLSIAGPAATLIAFGLFPSGGSTPYTR